jgi:hypothetical protein
MRFEVPQFIEIEDKIIGPFTWKQFVYLAGGVGMLIILFFSLPLPLFAIFGIPFGTLAGFLAFHKVNNRPFSLFLEAVLNYARRGRLYLWHKDGAGVIDSGVEQVHTSHDRRRLSALAEKLETYTLEK